MSVLSVQAGPGLGFRVSVDGQWGPLKPAALSPCSSQSLGLRDHLTQHLSPELTRDMQHGVSARVTLWVKRGGCQHGRPHCPPPAALDRGDSGHSGSLGAQGEGSQQESPLPRLSGQEQGRREQSRAVGDAAVATRGHDDWPWL